MIDLELEKKLFLNNIKIINFRNVLLSLGYVLAMLFMINKDNLLEEWIVVIVEEFMSPIGIILFAKIAIVEYESKMNEFTYTKVYPYWRIVLTRIIIVSIELLAIISAGLCILKTLGGEFEFLKILFGGFVTSFYLGVIAILFAYVAKRIEIGYLVPFLYYFLEIFSKGKYTRNLYLFGMVTGDYVSKVKLFMISIILTIFCMVIIKKES